MQDQQFQNINSLQKLYSVQGNTFEEVRSNFTIQQKKHLKKLFQYISDEYQLNQFQLRGDVIGVAFEHTNDIGFDGQISIVQFKDDTDVYIIDVIEIGLENLKLINVLKTIFEDQKIIKVFYAGNTNIQQFKRDFLITVQNYCDIKEIADCCKFKGGSTLIYLWKQYCDHQVSKSYKNIQLGQKTFDIRIANLCSLQLLLFAISQICFTIRTKQIDINQQIQIQNKFDKAILKNIRSLLYQIKNQLKLFKKNPISQ